MPFVPIIIGSPRKNGDTVSLANECKRGLLNRNISSQFFILNDMKFSGCQACYGCKGEDSTECIRNDDMRFIYDAIGHLDGLIVATPIYFGGVTGQTKLWLDRLFPYLSMELGTNLPKKIPISCIYTQNQPDATLFIGAMDTFEYMLHLLGFEVKNRLIAPNLDFGTKPPVSEYPDLMQRAYQIGCSILPGNENSTE